MNERSRPVSRRRRLLQPWLLATCALASVAFAQSAPPEAVAPGVVQGQVVSGLSRPIPGAWVGVDYEDGRVLHRDTKTDASGHFAVADLPPGRYSVTAQVENLTPRTYGAIVNPGRTTTVAFQLVVDPAAMARKRDAEEAARQQLVAEGINLTAAGNDDQAIERFRRAIGLTPDCAVCFFNLGRAQSAKRDFDAAEASFQQAIQLNPDYADAYGGLASVYTARHQFDRAVEAGVKAADLGARLSPTLASSYRYNEGIYLWNAGRIPEAASTFELAAQLDPGNEDAHFQLALALINQGQLQRAAAELATYLKLAPEGRHAARARTLLESLRK